MFKNGNTKRNKFYIPASFLGLCCVLWLILTLKNADSDPINHAQKQDNDLLPAVSFYDDGSSIEYGLDPPKNSLGQIKEVAGNDDRNEREQCSTQCNSALAMLDGNVALNDETFHSLGAYIEEIAAYLQHDESKRQHYLQMALATTQADKRAFLTDVFMHLPYQQKAKLGEHLTGSDNWQVRADGVALIADHAMPDIEVANALMTVFSSEESAYVKGRILSSLSQSSTLRGDLGILHQLDSALYKETAPSVRVAALKAKMRLSEQPHHILPDALQALRTSDPEFQLAGLIAIEKVLAHENKQVESGVYIDRNSIRNEFQIIRDLAVYDDDKKRFDRLIREANIVYSRYFQ